MERPIRILFVNRMAATERGGGETFDLEISRHLARLGCDVTFLSNIPVFGKAQLPVPNGILIRSPMFPWFPWDKVKGGWRVRVWEFKQFEKKAAKWISRHAEEFDIIQICELPYLVSLLKSRIPHPRSRVPFVVMRLTAPNAHDPWGGVTLADALIASGTSIGKIRSRVRPDVHDIPNGVDVERFRRDSGFGIRDTGYEIRDAGIRDQESEVGGQWSVVRSQRSELGPQALEFRSTHGIPESVPLLLYVARFQAFKNHRLLVEAFARVAKQVPGIRLALAGSGPLRQEIEAMCTALDICSNIIFLSEVPYDELPRVYAAADVMVISSEYESFCFAAIEAMASGLPVVTTDCGWVPKLVGDQLLPIDKQWVQGADVPGRFVTEMDGKRIRHVPGGLVVSRTEPESLAYAIQMMLRDPSMRETCGLWNREKAVREHGWESSAKKLLGVYEGLRSGVSGLRSDV